MDVQSSEVVDVPEHNYYAIRVNGAQVGLTAYQLDGRTITFTHTETAPELQGRGLAGQLVQGALDDVRSRGLGVVPQCSYVKSWIAEHPEYADLVES